MISFKEHLKASGKLLGNHPDPSLSRNTPQHFFTLDGKGLNFTAIRDCITEAANAVERMSFDDVKGESNGFGLSHWVGKGVESMRNVAAFVSLWQSLDGKAEGGLRDLSMAAMDIELDLDKAWRDVALLWEIITHRPKTSMSDVAESGLKVFMPIFFMVTSRQVSTEEIGRVGRVLAKRINDHYRSNFQAVLDLATSPKGNGGSADSYVANPHF